jgi:hypothetical protein
MLIYNNTITQNQRPEGYNGWPIKGWNDGHLKGVKIYNNTLIKKPYGGSYPGESGWDFAIELFNISGVEINGNTIQGSIDSNTQTKGIYPYSVWIHDNTLSQPVLNKNYESGIILEFSTENAIIEKNIFNNVSMGVQFNTRDKSFVRNITIQNNLMTNLGRNIGDGNNGGAIAFISESTHNAVLSNINIYNNTMVAASGNEPWEGIEFGDAISGTGGSATNINIKNNIVVGFKDAWLRANNPTHTNQISVTNNNLYQNANDNMPLWPGGNPTNYTYANNLSVDPKFVGGGNYSLQESSPLINAGVNVGLPYNGSAPDIGYGESPAASNNGGGSGGTGGGGSGSGGGSTQCPNGTTGVYPNCVPVVVTPPTSNKIFYSDDGYYEPFYIELMVNKLEENNDIVFCPVKNTNLSNETTEWQISELNKYSIADLQHDNGCYIYSGSFMARTSIILNYAWSLNPFEGRLTNRLFSEIFRKPYRIGTISEPVLYNHIETDMTQRETSQDEINNVIANQL